jgi:uracil-DNA glycosylase
LNDLRILRELELDQVVRLYRAAAAQPAEPSTGQAPLCGVCARPRQAVAAADGRDEACLFVGEDPGADSNEPFAGAPGKLLDGMLHAIGFAREEAGPFDDRQVERVAPRLIVALGRAAAARFLPTDESLDSLRGRVHRYNGLPLVVTIHPADLLERLPDKAKAWEDLLFARRTLREAA